MVREIIAKKAGYSPNEIAISRNRFGKPQCDSFPSFHFSVSHSGVWVVSAFDNQPLGIDIQKIIDLPGSRMDLIVKRFFHNVEQIRYFAFEGKERQDFFFTTWAAKESYTKLRGTGLGNPLQEFSALLDNQGRGSISDKVGIRYLQRYEIEDNYRMVICASNRFIPRVSLRKLQCHQWQIYNYQPSTVMRPG